MLSSMIKKVLVTVVFVAISAMSSVYAQINSINDFVEKTQELRTLSQKLGTYYILTQLYPTNEDYQKKREKNIESFNSLVVELTENAPSEELSIELQKFNLTWLYVNKILQQKYDRAMAGKILDKLEDLQLEAKAIADMSLKLTKKKQAEVVEKAAETRVQLQRMILYYIALKAKIINSKIKDRFEDARNKFKNNLSYLENTQYNDENTLMILDMIKNQFKSYGKKITLEGKVSPLLAAKVSEQLDDDLKLLVQTYKESLQ
jgi:hypothetical protein